MNEMSSRITILSPDSDVSVTYERVLESEPLIELIPEMGDKLEGVMKCLREGASLVSELDRIEQKQQTIECLLESNRELVQRVGVLTQNNL